MSVANDRTALSRLNKEIADLRLKESAEAKKAADSQKKLNAALNSARRASSPGLAKSYQNTADRETKNLQSAQDNQSRYSSKAALKTQEVARLHEKIAKEEDNERKKFAAVDERRRRDDEARRRGDEQRQRRAAAAASAMQQKINDLEAQLVEQLASLASATPPFRLVAPHGEREVYDVFISHASEDKDEFVRDLASKAREAGLKVWYDQFTLGWGDSLRQKIDAGLASSYFGIVVLSPAFFKKQWAQYELDGLVQKALSGTGRLLPIWHKVSKDEVAQFAPSLAGLLALKTSLMSISEIVGELTKLRDNYRMNVEDTD